MQKLIIIFLITLFFVASFAAENKSKSNKRSLSKISEISDTWFDVNRMNGVYRNNGTWLYDNIAGTWGLEWPKGSGLSPMYACGQWIGAIVDGEVRVAGIQHDATEYWAGEITEPFVAASSRAPQYRWYELYKGGTRPDGSVDDYADWPVDQGAPVDENGRPLLIGDRTMFCIYNDLADHSLYGSNKLSAEVRQLVFGFNRADALGDMQFVKWQLVNKSGMDWDSTYFCIWADADIGNGDDDFVGCDPQLGLGYCYNATDDDQNYGGAPPAVGIDFFQGPIIDQINSTVILPDKTELIDKKMLKMTTFIYYDNNDSPHGNPNNAGDIWNYFRAIWQDYTPITEGGRGLNPENPPTDFMFSGDPESGTGWLDSESDDRRFIMTTGPFNMPPWEDTNGNDIPDFGEPGVQEIVAAVIVARGTNNLNSVTRLKSVDALAQLAYDNNFKLSDAPAQPVVNVAEFSNRVVLTWDDRSEFVETGDPYFSADPAVKNSLGNEVILDNEIKIIDDYEYNFYGYSVYQYSDASGRDPVLVDHWDIGEIKDPAPYTDRRYIEIATNKHTQVGVKGNPLTNGKEYFFGVEAEGYLEFGSPVLLKSPPVIVTVTPQSEFGMRLTTEFGDSIRNVNHGLANANAAPCDGEVIVRVVDQTKVTGHDYEVFFDQQHYYRDLDGYWKHTNYADSIGKKLGKVGDLSGTYLTGLAITSFENTRDLTFVLHLVASDWDYSDGLKLTFPDDIEINSARTAIGNTYSTVVEPVIDFNENSIEWGSPDTTGDGEFLGEEVFVVNVNTTSYPLEVDFIVYDDGWAVADGDTTSPGVIDATGTVIITEEGYSFKTENHWNLRDATTDEVVLEDQVAVFPGSTDPGHAGAIVDGLQIIVKASYEAPVDFIGVGDNEWGDALGTYDIDSYGANNWGDWGSTAKAIDCFTDELGTEHGNGVTDMNILVQDYEIRFNGVYENTSADVIYVSESTGQMATIFGARGFDIADHPMNPNPGSSDPFLVRVPFEVWNVDTDQQVNMLIYDREQAADDVPFYAFNPDGRMYCWIDNSPYNPDTPNSADASSTDTDNLTWNLVFWECGWVYNDVLHFNYANPIQQGVDNFTFSTSGLAPEIVEETKKDDFDKIKVVPNPYYGSHSGEMDPFHRWVQFTFLPDECTIRIFDLAGNLVRRLNKTNDGSSLLQWDLKNGNQLPVASGIYVYHVESPGLGEKIGKIAVFTPNERLDTW